MKFVHPEALLAQLYIAVHLVHVGIYGLHQIAVNLRRHVVRIDCRFQRGRIISRLRIENLLLYLSVVKSGNRSGKLFVDAVKSFKRIFSDAAVARFLERHKIAVGKAHLLPVFILDLRVDQIRIVDDGVHLLRRLCHLSGHRHQFFHLRRKNMLFCAQDLIYQSAVEFQFLFFSKILCKRRFVGCQNLRHNKCRAALIIRHNTVHFLRHCLMLGVLLILVKQALRIIKRQIDLLLCARAKLQRRKKLLCGSHNTAL